MNFTESAKALEDGGGAAASPGTIIVQILLLDLVFSLDSVITAVGMVKSMAIMVAAILISVAVMIRFAGPIGGFVERHPALKMLALAFLILVGTVLMADAGHFHVPRGYLYFAIAFSIAVEGLNLLHRKRRGDEIG